MKLHWKSFDFLSKIALSRIIDTEAITVSVQELFVDLVILSFLPDR